MALRHQLTKEILGIRYPQLPAEVHDLLISLVTKNASPDLSYSHIKHCLDKQFGRVITDIETSLVNPNNLDDYLHSLITLHTLIADMSINSIKIEFGKEIKASRIVNLNRLRIEHPTKDEEAFFNDLDADADYAFWLQKPYWTAREAAALTLGKIPNWCRITR